MADPGEAPSELRTRCAICQQWSSESTLTFAHTRGAERVRLEITICEPCGTRLEKHLKRAVPKRLFSFHAAPGEDGG